MRETIDSLENKDFEYIYVNLREVSDEQRTLLDNLEFDINSVRSVPHTLIVDGDKVLYNGNPDMNIRRGDLSQIKLENDSV